MILFEASFNNGDVKYMLSCFVSTILDKSFKEVGKLLYGSFKINT